MNDDSHNSNNEAAAPGEPPLTDHTYDGIREYDNPLPGWWTYIFVGSIVFSVIYFYVTIADGTLGAVDSYQRDLIADTQRQFGSMQLKPDAATLIKLGKDDRMLSLGASIFQTNCVSCHGRRGEGLACPNLTDDYYIHVKKIDDFVDVITKGRNNGAMPAWGNRLSPNEVIVVGAYVASLRNTNASGGRKAEGTIPPPWSDR